MTQLEKLVFIDLAIKTVQEFIKETTEEDHYGDWEYLDSLRAMYLTTLSKDVTPNTTYDKQEIKELYEVLTEAHDKAMMETLTSIYDNNYVIPKEIPQDEILDFIEEVYLGEDDKPKASNHNVVVLDKEWLKSNKWWITSGEMEKHALLKAGIEVYDAGCDFDEEVEEYPYITHDLTEPFAVQTTVACKNFTQIHCINGEPVLLH